MNPEVKAKWLAALRSGEYRQGIGWLRTNDQFCCLGVLCDLHAKETGGEWTRIVEGHEGAHERYAGSVAYLPDVVNEWAGSPSEDTTDRLMGKNDDKETFTAIADIIEREL